MKRRRGEPRSKLSRLADRTFNNRLIGSTLRGMTARKIERFIATRADAIWEIIEGRRRHIPDVPEINTDSEEILYDLMREIGHTIEGVVKVIRGQDKLELGAVTAECRYRLEVYMEDVDEMADRIDHLNDPIAKALLRFVMSNMERWLAFCQYLEDEQLDSIDKVLQHSPEILAAISENEERILHDYLIKSGESPVIEGLLHLAIAFNKATRKRNGAIFEDDSAHPRA